MIPSNDSEFLPSSYVVDIMVNARPLSGGLEIEKGSVILLQIVMVSPGTHLVKNHESQFKKQCVHGSLCNYTVNLKTDSKTLYYSSLK